MTFALVCALCASQPALLAGNSVDPGKFHLLEERLSLRQPDPIPLPAPPVTLSLVPAPLPSAGSGDGEGGADHMGAMWIVMGAMMAVMMVGMGVYVMRHEAPSLRLHSAGALPSPARLAVPEGRVGGGGG